MFEIRNLGVSVDNKKIIEGLSLTIRNGELHTIMGPNGTGKSTLANALMGHPKLNVTGQIIIDGEDISGDPPNERAKKGLFLAFQHPQEIEGVNIVNFMRKAKTGGEDVKKKMAELLQLQKDIQKGSKKLGLGDDFIKRDLNVGFSGGEKKKNEILQMTVLNPKVMILDEIDSGLDIDAMKTVARQIESMRDGEKSFLLITHYQRILDYVKSDAVHIMVNGRIIKSGDHNLAKELEQKGYGGII